MTLIRRSLCVQGLLWMAGCSTPSAWSWDAIAAGDPAFDSVHLVYHAAPTYPELRLELFRTKSSVEAFLSLIPLTMHPGPEGVEVRLVDAQGVLQEWVVPFRGQMRLAISPHMTERLVRALLAGEAPELSVGGNSLTIGDAPGFLRVWEKPNYVRYTPLLKLR